MNDLIPILNRVSLCGCGEPDIPLQVIREVLEHSAPYVTVDWVNDDRFRLFAVYVMDKWKLTEHGGSVEGAWLTEDGKQILDFLQRIDCRHSRWAALDTAALNGPVPDAIDIAWLDAKAREYSLGDDDD